MFDSKLKTIKDNIQKLEEELAESKRQYSQALKNLENISDVIHERRAQILTKSLKREPGVGAELIPDSSDRKYFFIFSLFLADWNIISVTENFNHSDNVSMLSDQLKQL